MPRFTREVILVSKFCYPVGRFDFLSSCIFIGKRHLNGPELQIELEIKTDKSNEF